jgi:hypothetical protein
MTRPPSAAPVPLLDMIVDLWRRFGVETVAALFGVIGQSQPRTRHSEHAGLRERVGKLLGHREAVGSVSAVSSGSIHGRPAYVI